MGKGDTYPVAAMRRGSCPVCGVALTKPATRADAFSRTENSSLDSGRPSVARPSSRVLLEVLFSFYPKSVFW